MQGPGTAQFHGVDCGPGDASGPPSWGCMRQRVRRFYGMRGCIGLVVRLLASHLCEQGSILSKVSPRFFRAGWCHWSASFLGALLFAPSLQSGAASYSPCFTFIGSQDLDVKSRPNLASPLHSTVCICSLLFASRVSDERRDSALLVAFQASHISLAQLFIRLSASERSCADLARSFCDRWMIRLLFSAHDSGTLTLYAGAAKKNNAPPDGTTCINCRDMQDLNLQPAGDVTCREDLTPPHPSTKQERARKRINTGALPFVCLSVLFLHRIPGTKDSYRTTSPSQFFTALLVQKIPSYKLSNTYTSGPFRYQQELIHLRTNLVHLIPWDRAQAIRRLERPASPEPIPELFTHPPNSTEKLTQYSSLTLVFKIPRILIIEPTPATVSTHNHLPACTPSSRASLSTPPSEPPHVQQPSPVTRLPVRVILLKYKIILAVPDFLPCQKATLSVLYSGRAPVLRSDLRSILTSGASVHAPHQNTWGSDVPQLPTGRHVFHGGRVVRPLASHQDDPGLIPGRVTGFSHVGIVLDDTVGRRVSSGIFRFPRPFIPVPLHTPQSPSSALKILLLKATQISSLTLL
ncbi:hypothetical protein PR048_032525 [Dryococelus australis]|uniref:Uncharacterized protein n=1 Tax=Dryococelus australis TaxID=614101 RepID=A0ABQ9G2F3_9NEOP|nr:hypothetical protein PR048_032525 [Dryococelus australis]